MEFNKDELVPPPWMDKKFFQDALRESFKDSGLRVTSIEVKPGSKPGEHFASIMFRVVVEYQTSRTPQKTERLLTVVKTMPFAEGLKKEALGQMSIFKTEIKMYKEILPEMERLLRQIGDDTRLAPRLIYASLEPHTVMVFEDITPLGFVVPKQELCFEDAKKVARTLAKFHATSMVLNEKGLDLTKFDEYFFKKEDANQETHFFKDWVIGMSRATIGAAKQWKGFEVYAEKLEKRLDGFFAEIVDAFYNPNPQIHKVLIHGDFHVRNFMLRFENGAKDSGIKDLFMLDYQACFWTTPAIDLIYLIQMISNMDVKFNHAPDLITHYFEHFSSILKALHFKGPYPTLLDLNLELLKVGHVLEVELVVCMLPFFFFDFSKADADMEELIGGADKSAFMKAAIASPVYVDYLKKCLKKWACLGYLD